MENRVENDTDLKPKREPKEGGHKRSFSYRGRLDFLETVTAKRGGTQGRGLNVFEAPMWG